MTFILAANLSDRILLAGDTLVTRVKHDGSREVACYYPKLQQFANTKEGKPVKFVTALLAGDLNFAKFIAKRLAGAIEENRLSADIVELRRTIRDFLEQEMPSFTGRRKATIILAGTAFDGSVRTFDFNRIHDILGPSAGHFEDPVAIQALEMASQMGGLEKLGGKIPVMLPRQEIFQVKIDEALGQLEVSEAFGSFHILTAGTKDLSQEEKNRLLYHFLDNRPAEKEGSDIANFMRNQFSDSIGGGVMLGVIKGDRPSGGMSHVTYDVARDPNKPSPKNWSFSIEKDGPTVTDPTGKKISLLESHFDEVDGEGALDL